MKIVFKLKCIFERHFWVDIVCLRIYPCYFSIFKCIFQRCILLKCNFENCIQIKVYFWKVCFWVEIVCLRICLCCFRPCEEMPSRDDAQNLKSPIYFLLPFYSIQCKQFLKNVFSKHVDGVCYQKVVLLFQKPSFQIYELINCFR